ncbi:MAG: GNAT family N-acetyltransferase [Chitinophagales bacterium]
MQKINIRKATLKDFRQIANFIALLNVKAENHCLHCGTIADDIFNDLEDINSREECYFLLAFDDKKVVGLFGGECESDWSEFWLWGIFVAENYDFSVVAEMLWKCFLEKMAGKLQEATNFLNIKNEKTIAFFTEKGFESRGLNHEYFAEARKIQEQNITDFYEKSDFEALEKLHEANFPNTYYDTKQMLELPKERFKLFVLKKEKQLIAYIFIEMQVENNGHIHFLAVKKAERGKKIGTKLLNRALQWIFETKKAPTATLVVKDENDARRLYERTGFRLRYSGLGLRKKFEK